MATGIPRRIRSLFQDTPRSRSSGTARLRRGRESPRRPGRPESGPGSRRSHRRSNRNNRRSRGKPVCNPAARSRDTTVFLRNLPPASSFASRCGAHRRAESIAVWKPWPRRLLHPPIGLPRARMLPCCPDHSYGMPNRQRQQTRRECVQAEIPPRSSRAPADSASGGRYTRTGAAYSVYA